MITIYLKPSNFCAIDCEHCYLPTDVRTDKALISFEELSERMIYIRDIASTRDTKVFVIIHGGEPLSLPGMSSNDMSQWYEKAFNIMKGILGEYYHRSMMQTSLLHYKKSSPITEIIKKYNDGFVGTSYDRFREIHGSHLEYQNKWLKKVHNARSDDLQIGVTIVPDKSMVDYQETKQVIGFLHKSGFTHIHIDRGLGSDVIPNNKEHSTILINLYKAAEEFDIAISVVDASIQLMQSYLTGNTTTGDRWGTSCTKDFFTIEPNGDMHSCPDISANTAWNKEHDSLLRIEWQRDYLKRQIHSSDCQICEYQSFCKSGCPITPIEDGSGECAGYKDYLNFLLSELQAGARYVRA